MKVRSGFVSNSSSSSFVCIATRESHEKAMAKLDPDDRLLVAQCVSFKKFGNEEIALVAVYSSNEGASSYSGNFTHADARAPDLSDYDLDEERGEGEDWKIPLDDALNRYQTIIEADEKATTVTID